MEIRSGALQNSSSAASFSSDGYYTPDDDPDYVSRRGTPLDDGAFGYDYWDDPDDRYEMDRNQMDAFPDEW